MAYKTISVSLAAYKRLKSSQLADESFSEEILRLLGKERLSDAAGILSEKEADEIEARINDLRRSARVRKWR